MIKDDKVYAVTAYRWSDKENHSYLVGIYQDENDANYYAEKEEDHRGGKYECEIIKVLIGEYRDDNKEIIKSLTNF